MVEQMHPRRDALIVPLNLALGFVTAGVLYMLGLTRSLETLPWTPSRCS